jgi:hypothetical protein
MRTFSLTVLLGKLGKPVNVIVMNLHPGTAFVWGASAADAADGAIVPRSSASAAAALAKTFLYT